MNKHQIEGRVEQAKGKVKEVAGKLIRSDKLQVQGLADQAGGRIQATYGDARNAVRSSARRVVNKI